MTGSHVRAFGAAAIAAWLVFSAVDRADAADSISPAELAGLRSALAAVLVIDLRTSSEFMAGSLVGAVHGRPTPGRFIPEQAVTTAVLIPPAGNGNAPLAAWTERLESLGLRVLVLEGAREDWRAAGLAIQQPGPTYADPGKVPFVIPRGICEHLPPVEEYR